MSTQLKYGKLPHYFDRPVNVHGEVFNTVLDAAQKLNTHPKELLAGLYKNNIQGVEFVHPASLSTRSN